MYAVYTVYMLSINIEQSLANEVISLHWLMVYFMKIMLAIKLTNWSTWFASSIYPILVCLDSFHIYIYCLTPFVLIYFFYECMLLYVFILCESNRTKQNRKCIEVIRPCNQHEKNLLIQMYEQTKPIETSILQENNENKMNGIKWFNVWMIGVYETRFENSSIRDEFMAWVKMCIKECYPNETRHLASIGFIQSAKNSLNKPNQKWHIDDDYDNDISNIFVPMNELTIHNSTQFVRGNIEAYESKMRLLNDGDFGPNKLMKSEKRMWLEVCQVVCEPFMLLKMHNIAHKGIKLEYLFLYFFATNCHLEMPMKKVGHDKGKKIITKN